MKFALFYEIPVPRPWEEDSELVAYQNTLEEAIAGDKFGWHAFWTVEHHFLQEYSHCSNPEVLYGAIASRTQNIRLGYGVRLMPKPYNHPVRTAESVAVLDLLSKGRVDMGAGRSATRAELEGFGIDPAESRQMWQEAIGHIVGCWTNDEYEFEGEYWQMPRRRVQPKPWQKPHPPLWGATTTDDGHAQVGSLGLGLCSFAVGLPPSEVKRKIDVYRDAVDQCTEPIGSFVNNQAATFTMALCGPDAEKAEEEARESFEWYPKAGARQIATLTDWMAERKQDLGNYSYAADMKKSDDEGTLDLLSLEYLVDANACVLGTPEQCLAACREYEAAGVDLLLCLVNPYKISHEAVMQTIELMGTEVIPHFAD
jgi:alkanesulfonate monooxygenase SsuD/methylene tetrahydromethanopterin reductase-like flavin-dependent oxidoreductase (luciferase family)